MSKAGFCLRDCRNRYDLEKAAISRCRICLWVCSVLAPKAFMEETGGPGSNAPPIDVQYPYNLYQSDNNLVSHNSHVYPPVLRYDPSTCAIIISTILPTMIAKNLSVFADEG
jgi:hypothetical protein